jgi:hypothetical protein
LLKKDNLNKPAPTAIALQKEDISNNYNLANLSKKILTEFGEMPFPDLAIEISDFGNLLPSPPASPASPASLSALIAEKCNPQWSKAAIGIVRKYQCFP